MRVEASKQASYNGAERRAQTRAQSYVPTDSAEPAVESRALTVIAPITTPQPPEVARQANFLAHLIATKNQAPQTRARRRAEPEVAIAAYRSTAALLGA